MVAAAMASCDEGKSCVGPGVKRRPLRIIMTVPVLEFCYSVARSILLKSAGRAERVCEPCLNNTTLAVGSFAFCTTSKPSPSGDNGGPDDIHCIFPIVLLDIRARNSTLGKIAS